MQLVPTMLYFVVLVVSLALGHAFNCNHGTTPRFKEIVMGRCWNYKQLKNLTNINCTKLWERLYDGFANKDPCKVKTTDYEGFFDAGNKQDIVDKTLFWSGTKKAVHDYSDFDLRYTTLEDTLEGSMLNDLCWCGQISGGIDYKSCPSKCGNEFLQSTTAFWALASEKFAKRSRGLVRVMVNGTRLDQSGNPIPAYQRTSFFGKMELPNLDPSTTTLLKILVVHTIGEKKEEECGTGSIKLLKEDAENLNLTVKCINDQVDIKHILCSYDPEDRECLFRDESPPPNCRLWKITAIALAALLFIALLALLLVLILRRKKHKRFDNPPLT